MRQKRPKKPSNAQKKSLQWPTLRVIQEQESDRNRKVIEIVESFLLSVFCGQKSAIHFSMNGPGKK